jgi:hypothetical protein
MIITRQNYNATISVVVEFVVLALNTSRRQAVMLGVASSTIIAVASVPPHTSLPLDRTDIGLGGIVARRC